MTKKQKKILAGVVGGVLALVLVPGVVMVRGAASKDGYYRDVESQKAMLLDVQGVEEATSRAEGAGGITPEQISAELSARKIIKNIDASIETRDLEAYLKTLEQNLQAVGGYTENSSHYRDRDGQLGSVYLTLRVPSVALERFQGMLEDSGKVTSVSVSTEDVTLRYTDVETHLNALKTERDSLLKLLEQAGKLEEILAVQERLTNVRYELDSLESQLRLLENQVSMSRVSLSIEQVERLVQSPKTFFGRIGRGFVNSIRSIGHGAATLVEGLIIGSPYIVLFGGLAALVIVFVIRRKRKLKQKK